MNSKGLDRGNDQNGKFDFAIQNRGQFTTALVPVTVSNASPVPAAAKFTDFWGQGACVCSGAVQVFGTSFICVLKEDSLNGSAATGVTEMDDIWLPADSADTFAAGTVVYWEIASYFITTSNAGTNIKCGIALGAIKQVTSDVLNELPTGYWVRVQLQKYI